jgi:hypothetical protein
VPILSKLEGSFRVKTGHPFRSLGILRNAVYPILDSAVRQL